MAGTFVDACSCPAVCPCDVADLKHGCQDIGALALRSGQFKGTDLSGARFAYASVVGGWLRIYVDARSDRQRQAAMDFGRALFSQFGKIEAVKAATIQVTGQGGRYTITVDRGRIMKLTTAPVLGGDGRTPVAIQNHKNPLVSTYYQGKTISATYRDGNRSVKLRNSNAFFNPNVNRRGTL